MPDKETRSTQLLTPLTIDVGEQIAFRLGQLEALVEKTESEWRQSTRFDSDRFVTNANEEVTCSRLLGKSSSSTLQFRPLLADRNVVASLTEKARIDTAASATLFVSTPLWIRTMVGSGDHESLLAESPTEIMSDTWFGPNTRIGEVCYAEDTHARVQLDLVERVRSRAVTPLTIVNEGEDSLLIEKISLPVERLSLYQAADGFWTQEVSITREASFAEAELRFADEPPRQAMGATKITGARTPGEGRLARAMHLLFST